MISSAIAVSRQFGSGGCQIDATLAKPVYSCGLRCPEEQAEKSLREIDKKRTSCLKACIDQIDGQAENDRGCLLGPVGSYIVQ